MSGWYLGLGSCFVAWLCAVRIAAIWLKDKP